MFDDMSLCVTQKDDEVKVLAKKVKHLETNIEGLQDNLRKQTKDYEGLLAALDYKLEEKVQEIKKNQEVEINNIKRMMLKQLETDMPLQMQSKSSNHGAENAQEQRKELRYIPIRGRKNQQKVPPINLGENNGDMQQI